MVLVDVHQVKLKLTAMVSVLFYIAAHDDLVFIFPKGYFGFPGT
jgi:hypothetical protein